MRNDLNTEGARRKLERAKEAMDGRSLAVHQLAEAIHISLPHAYRYVEMLRGKRGKLGRKSPHTCVIYIAAWPWAGEKRPRRIPAYRLMLTGKEKDAEKPAALSRVQRTRRQIERIRNDPAVKEHVNALRRLNYQDPVVNERTNRLRRLRRAKTTERHSNDIVFHLQRPHQESQPDQ